MKVRPLHDRSSSSARTNRKRRSAASSSRTPRRKSRSAPKSWLSATARSPRRASACPRRQERRPHPVRKYSGNEVKIDGDDYLILREEDVLAILE